ncbi:ABC transporter ATP-binding protein [Actinobacillus minor 202]|uniref:ABC transporter ATP-binding protein n=1 Tax=Actinobacillus minor 202 TaxID=591023 RepID=A0ABP2F825_9PAST|nr:ABC transporter ATP-binding protein [Actinobacillus minor]EER48309.1 ABC transporter ATP-binding protein [Actinobacillus minor 202]
MKRNSFFIMWQLLKLVKPLSHVMLFTIIMGTLGFLSAISIMGFGALGFASLLDFPSYFEFHQIINILIFLAVLRGVFRYLEHMSGHYIAFKLLALLRNKVFEALRKLALIKLQSKQAGQLLSLITNDIELLEVFYAHTIAPIVIAFLTSLILIIILGHVSIIFSVIALFAYLVIGVIIPYITTRTARDYGREYRGLVGELNDYFLDSIRGMKEILLFNNQQSRLNGILGRSKKIDSAFLQLKEQEGKVRIYSELAISIFNILILFIGIVLYIYQEISFSGLLISVILLMSSYGPVIALSNLSNNLLQTLASGERVLDLLNEEPVLKDVINGKYIQNIKYIQFLNVGFSYESIPVLQHVTFTLEKGKIIGVYGKSGSGKSTLLKLIMRFYEPQFGQVNINGVPLQDINTQCLRNNISYITQKTYIFNESIYENIILANRQASYDDVIEAARKASIHEFIMGLPNGYETKVSELGSNLSDGEKQRIGLARAFLHNSPIILLDEPTSNLDSLNEAIILKSLLSEKEQKLIILVSHRPSTMSICDEVINIETARAS